MKEGVNQSLEVPGEIGGKVQEEAIRAGYGPTIRAEAVKRLVDSVVAYPGALARDHRRDAPRGDGNSQEISRSVEDAKRRLARLAREGTALPANAA
jgi:hypothetical protein